MAPVEAGGLVWASVSSSSLQISFVSILFIVLVITVLTLCTSCCGLSPELPESTEIFWIPSSLTHQEVTRNTEKPSINGFTTRDEHASSHDTESWVPRVLPKPGPHSRSLSMAYNPQTKVYSHSRSESHGYFSPGLVTLQELHVALGGSIQYPTIQGSPSLPSTPRSGLGPVWQSDTSIRMQGPVSRGHLMAESGEHQLDLSPNHVYSELGPVILKEHPYESIGMVREAGHPLPPTSEEASEDEEEEPTYQTVKELVESPVSHLKLPTNVSGPNHTEGPCLLVPPPKHEKEGPYLIGKELSAVYAVVNWKKKSTFNHVEFPILSIPAVPDGDVDDEEEHSESVPAIPEKSFQ